MKGPCLCGDTYCPSCGDPGLAEAEAYWEIAQEMVDFVPSLRKALDCVNEEFLVTLIAEALHEYDNPLFVQSPKGKYRIRTNTSESL